MKWPDGFSDGCKLLRPDAIFVIFEAINERINWLNEVNGKTVISLLEVPGRFVVNDGTELNNIKNSISNKIVSMSSYFFSNVSDDGYNMTRSIGSSTLTNKYGNPNNLSRVKLSHDFDSNWLFCAYKWLNELIYPVFDITVEFYVDSQREVDSRAVSQFPREETIVYTKNGSSVELSNGTVLENFAWANSRPSAAAVDEYFEQAETLYPGWSRPGLFSYEFVNGTYGEMNSQSVITGKAICRAQKLRFVSQNSYISEFNCRAKWTNFSKWTRKKNTGLVSINYPEHGSYFYGTIKNGTSADVAIPIYDDPDYHFSNTMQEAMEDPELFICAAQFCRPAASGEAEIASLPTPPYVYFNPIQEENA